jgi:hypothetical protein
MKAWWLANNKRARKSLIDGLFVSMMMMWLSGILLYAGYITSYGELIFMGVFSLILPVTIIIDAIRDFNKDEDLY